MEVVPAINYNTSGSKNSIFVQYVNMGNWNRPSKIYLSSTFHREKVKVLYKSAFCKKKQASAIKAVLKDCDCKYTPHKDFYEFTLYMVCPKWAEWIGLHCYASRLSGCSCGLKG